MRNGTVRDFFDSAFFVCVDSAMSVESNGASLKEKFHSKVEL